MKILLSFFLVWTTTLVASAQPIIDLEVFASGFAAPVDITHAGDERLFVVEQDGRIRIIDGNGNRLSTPFLDISGRSSSGGERGLLGLAFHPNYAQNGYFYVNYTNNSGDTQISRFSVMENDPNRANSNSEFPILTIDQPFSNHNGGDLNFGPDGYLYIGMGDGGSGGDPDDYSQNRMSLLGKMLRIDVDNGNPYAIPPDNPFAEDDFTADEIWAIGLRNPWRFSFDRETGDMWIGDVGQNNWEEIDFQPADSEGGENYGWDCFEGNHNFAFSSDECGNDTYTFPVFEYENTSGVGCSVTGGVVYRGSDFPALEGYYLLTDFCTGRFWSIRQEESGNFESTSLGNFGDSDYTAFGEDVNGEVFVTGISSGNIYRIVDVCAAFAGTSVEVTLSETTLTAEAGFTTYQWFLDGEFIAGATDNVYTAEVTGNYTVQVTNADGCSATSEPVEVVITSLSELSLERLNLTPNPFEQSFQIELNALQAADFQFQLRDALGRTVLEHKERISGAWTKSFPGTALAPGIYYLTIRSGGKELVRKVVKSAR